MGEKYSNPNISSEDAQQKNAKMSRREFLTKGILAAAGIGAGVLASRYIKNQPESNSNAEVKDEKEIDLKMAMVSAETIFYALHEKNLNFQGQQNRVQGYDNVELTYQDNGVPINLKANELDNREKEILIQLGASLQFHISLFHSIECKTDANPQFHKVNAVELEQLDEFMEKLIQTNNLNNQPIDPNFQGG